VPELEDDEDSQSGHPHKFSAPPWAADSSFILNDADEALGADAALKSTGGARGPELPVAGDSKGGAEQSFGHLRDGPPL